MMQRQIIFGALTLLGLSCGLLCVEHSSAEPEGGPTKSGTGMGLSPESAKFVAITTLTPSTNLMWGRRMPARVLLQTSAHVNLGATIEGRVEQVLVRPGDRVLTGAPLLKIHSVGGGQARADALQAIARLQAAQESLRRFEAMSAKGVATELELSEAKVHAQEAQIEAERAQGATSLLGTGNGVQFLVTAPTNGVVLSISTSVGASLQPGNDLIEIGDPSRVWLEADVSAEDAGEISPGQRAQILLPRTGTGIDGKVETVNAQVDPLTGRRQVFLVPDCDATKTLTPGALVDVRMAQAANQIILPVESVLIKEGERRIVYVQDANGQLQAREVLVDTASEGKVRVLQGLSIGERVVVKGALLIDGRSEQLL